MEEYWHSSKRIKLNVLKDKLPKKLGGFLELLFETKIASYYHYHDFRVYSLKHNMRTIREDFCFSILKYWVWFSDRTLLSIVFSAVSYSSTLCVHSLERGTWFCFWFSALQQILVDVKSNATLSSIYKVGIQIHCQPYKAHTQKVYFSHKKRTVSDHFTIVWK